MAGDVKFLRFSDGVTVTAPTTLNIPVTGLSNYADDAAFVTGKGSAAASGDIYFNTTSGLIRFFNGTEWADVGSGSGGGGINLIENPDGVNELDQGQTNDVGDWIDSGTGTTSSKTTTASEIPLSPLKDTAIKILNDGSGTAYTRYRFTMPESLKNWGNMPLSFFQRQIGAYASDDLEVQLYTNSASDYTGGYTQLTFSDGGDTARGLKALDGKTTMTFSTSDANYYELRIVRSAGSASTGLGLNDVRIGPDPVLYAPNSLWKEYTDSNSNGGDVTVGVSNATATLTSLISSSFVPYKTFDESWRLRFSMACQLSANETGVFEFTIGGCTFAKDDEAVSVHAVDTGLSLVTCYGNTTVSTDEIEIRVAAGARYYRIMGDVALSSKPTWADDLNTQTLAANDVEYAYNTDSDNATNTTDFGYGPDGVDVPTTDPAGTISKRVRFTTPIEPTDTIKVQIDPDGDGNWHDLTGQFRNSSNIQFSTFQRQGTSTYGMGALKAVSGSNTDVDVMIGRYSVQSNTTYDNTGQGWGSLAGNTPKWRVVKHKSGIATNYGTATSNRQGLIYGFEYLSNQDNGALAVAGTVEDITGDTVTLPAGTYLIEAGGSFRYLKGSTQPTQGAGRLEVALADNTTLLATNSGLPPRFGGLEAQAWIGVANTYTSATEFTIKLRGSVDGTGGSGTTTLQIFDAFLRVDRIN